MKWWRSFFSLVALIAFGAPLSAQPISADRFERRFQERPEIQSQLRLSLPEARSSQAPNWAASIVFRLEEIDFDGLTLVSASEFDDLVSPLLGEMVSYADIWFLKDQVRERIGNVATPVVAVEVPPQDIDRDGAVITIRVIEGFIKEVDIQGEIDDRRGVLRYYADAIMAERPLSMATYLRYMLLARRLPGLAGKTFDGDWRLRGVNEPLPGEPGAWKLTLVIEPASFNGSLTVDNRGDDAVGIMQYDGQISANNLFGMQEKTTVRYINASFSDELHLGRLTHSTLLHPEGTMLTLDGKYTTAAPGTAVLKQAEFESKSLTGAAEISHPFLVGREENLTVTLGFDFREAESKVIGVTVSDDQIRSARLTVNYDFTDQFGGRNQIILSGSQGLAIFGADNRNANASRGDGRVDYSKAVLQLTTEQSLGALFDAPELTAVYLKLSGKGQIAGSGLLSAEECGVGGAEFGRAYDASEITGDHCLIGSAELSYIIANPDPFATFDPYIFFDGGQVWNNDPSQPNGALASVGFGTRFSLTHHLSGSFELAQPLTRGVASESDSKDIRAFFSLTGRF